jgi:hypothetical protein
MRVKYLKDAEPYQKGDVVEVPDDRADNLIENGTVEQVSSDTEVRVQATENKDAVNRTEEIQRERLQKTADASGREATGRVGDEDVTAKPGSEQKESKKK